MHDFLLTSTEIQRIICSNVPELYHYGRYWIEFMHMKLYPCRVCVEP